MAKKIAVLLSGCGVFDGAEIHESVLTLLALDEAGVEVVMTAPSGEQMHVVNHLTGEVAADEQRDILVEAARIARGQIVELDELNLEEVDGVVLPGGFGVAKNLCDFAVSGAECGVHPRVEAMLKSARSLNLPLGFACISPALAAAVFREGMLTVGSDEDPAADGLRALGVEHIACERDQVVCDHERHIVSTPAYMAETTLSALRDGLRRMVDQVVTWAHEVDGSEHAEALKQLEGWSMSAGAITKSWRFDDDQGSIAWVNKLWSLAQERGHHPDVELGYNTVSVRLTTHDAGGITKADFALAHSIDALS